MKRISIAGAALVGLFATTAFAADLAPKTYTKAPPMIVDPGYNWTGFYAGINGGYSWGRAGETVPVGAPFAAFASKQQVDGGLAGGQIGYSWQVDPKWVLGLEADAQWTGERGSSNFFLGTFRGPTPGNDFNFVTSASVDNETKLPWFATFRGRAGFLADPSLLLYVTGGLAVGEVSYRTQTTTTFQLFGPGTAGTTPQGPAVTAATAFAENQTRVGWVVGGGLEKKFSREWSAKLEYLYMDLGSKTYFGGTANAVDVSFHDQIVRAGINYQFTAGPVVAKY